jgi:hypothetical protein
MIPTAEDIMKKYETKKEGVIVDPWGSMGEMFNDNDVEAMMIEFAKIHVEAALKEGSENAEANYNAEVNKSSILNAYPLENIK